MGYRITTYFGSNSMPSIPTTIDGTEVTEILTNLGVMTVLNANLIQTVDGWSSATLKKLTSVSLPKCTTLSSYAFAGHRNLSTINIPNCQSFDSYCLASIGALGSSLNLSKATYISDYAFYDTSLAGLSIGSNISYIAPNAFANARISAENISFDSAAKFSIDTSNYCIYDKSNSSVIVAMAGYGSELNLDSRYTLGSNVGFGDNAILRSVQVSLSSIPYGAFSHCEKLTTANLPNAVSISNYTFAGCPNLTSISLPMCSYIGDAAFMSCIQLSSITLPECQTLVGSTFVSCPLLESVYLPGSTMCSLQFVYKYSIFDCTPIANSEYLGYYGSIYVPASLLSAYQTDSMWSKYSERFAAITQ